MAVSLVKTTINNATGSVTPNMLLYGMFEYNQGDAALHINAPSFAGDGQLFCIKVYQVSSQEVTWDSSYRGSVYSGGPGNTNIAWFGMFIHDQGDSIMYEYGLMYAL